MTEKEAIDKFQELGYSYEDHTAGRGVGSLNDKTFHKDPDLPNVLAFPSGTDLTTTNLYQEGAVFLQDKVKRMLTWISQLLWYPLWTGQLHSCQCFGSPSRQ